MSIRNIISFIFKRPCHVIYCNNARLLCLNPPIMFNIIYNAINKITKHKVVDIGSTIFFVTTHLTLRFNMLEYATYHIKDPYSENFISFT